MPHLKDYKIPPKDERYRQIPHEDETSVLDMLTDMVGEMDVKSVDIRKAEKALEFLKYQWKGLSFAKVTSVVGMGATMFLKENKGQPTAIIDKEEYRRKCAEERERGAEENFKKSTHIRYDWGFYGWARLLGNEDLSGELAFFHHTNYRQPDFGIYKNSRGIEADFFLTDARDELGKAKTPITGDYICGIVQIGKKNKYEFKPWFRNSKTIYRIIKLIQQGLDGPMYYREKGSPRRIVASMIANGNEVLIGKHHPRFMTPVNSEDTALSDNFLYASIAMVLVLHIRPTNPKKFMLSPTVDGVPYWDFLENLGNTESLRRMVR